VDKKNIETFYPVSPLQQGFIFHSLLEPDSGAYVLQLSFTMQGNLNIAAFEQAWQFVMNRHAVFRTSFLAEGVKEFVQVVHKKLPVPLTVHDWRGLSNEEEQERWEAFQDEDRKRGFVLDEAPLMRLTLFQISDDTYRFLWSSHHLLMDGWSMPLVAGEFFASFDALSNGRTIELPATRPYRDYIVWLRKQNMRKAEQFWKRKMKGFLSPTPLPMDRMTEETVSNGIDFSEHLIQLPAEFTEEVKTFTRKNKLTISTLVQGAWAYLLSRYSNESDVVFGAIGSGRPADLPGVETMVGMFINTLPVRVHVQDDVSVLSWLQTLQGEFADLREYEYCPLVQIQGWSEVAGGEGLFESIAVYENYPVSSDAAEGTNMAVQIRDVKAAEQTNYPLTLVAAPGEQMPLRLLYDRKRFSQETVNRLLEQMALLLEQMVYASDKKMGDLSLLSQAETDLMVLDWNNAGVDQSPKQSVHQVFEAQAAKTPDAIALVMGEESLTYSELNRRANQLARYLQQQGVGADRLVGLCMERSLDMIVGLLGILKAGGAYVPLDPAYPQERLTYMLEDSQVALLVTQAHLQDKLPEHQAKTVCLDTDWAQIAEQSDDNLTSNVTPDNLAYVIYTSGSTGLPKGVLVPHRGIVRLVTNTNYADFSSDHVFLQASTISFDAATFEIWGSLLSGAKLAILPPHMPTLEEIGQALQHYGVTTLWLTVGLFNLMVDTHLELLQGVKQLLVGGDALSISHIRKAFALEGTQLINGYGPTESTTFTCCHLIREEDLNGISIPIGRPISNTQVYVLDQQGQPVPVGMPGELHIGGDGLARGYLNRPDLTEEKFIPNPFSNDPEARLYKTGDLVRYLPDGHIEFMGRIDNQVKIRGFRIELGEIEAVLDQHVSVGRSVVRALEDAARGKQLVAYVIPEPGHFFDVQELSTFLGSKLPEYMVPSAFVEIEELPLTANGKIDYRALPAPDAVQYLTTEYVAPRTPVEEMVANVFAHILHVDKVGLYDNFFSLGGHSLLATQANSRLREAFDINLPLRALFECPTVEQLAQKIEFERTNGQSLLLMPIEAVNREERTLPISYAQQRLWFYDQLVPGSALYNIPAFLQIQGPLQLDLLNRALSQVVERHEALRTTFADVDGEAIQVIAAPQEIQIPVIDLREYPADRKQEELRVLADSEITTPFDLQAGPLMRARLVQLADEDFVLMLGKHHIISDGWSMGIFISELFKVYNALAKGIDAALPPLPIQYADFAVWQRETLQGETLEKQMSYWKEKLAGGESLLKLPTDRPRPATPTYRGEQFTISLPSELLSKLNELSQAEGTTLFMTLLAAYQVLLARYSGQEDVTVGSPIAGRNRQELEGLIGFFVNMLVLRTDLSGNPTFRELLARVRGVALGAYEHQDVPFEKIVDEVVEDRSLSYTPLFQTMFILQNLVGESVPMEGLSVTSGTLSDEVMAKFDLTLTCHEGPEVLSVTFEYSTDLFDHDTILRMSERFVLLLEGIVDNPKQEIGLLPFMTESEQKSLVEWNHNEIDYPRDRSMHQLFEAQVLRTPDAVALVVDTQSVTYAELNQRANQLAHFLRRQGVTAGSLVGICTERTVEMVVGLLGILKASAAYVPLDPMYPQDRIAYTLEDAQVSVLLTQDRLVAELPEHSAKVVRLDADWDAIAQESTENPACIAKTDDLAYVIYTSGSTGRPKGVAIEHRSAVAFIAWAQEVFTAEQWRGVLASTSICFDLSVYELFGTLSVGGKVILAENALYLPTLPAKDEVTLINTVPSAAAQLLRMNGIPQSVRTVNLAGEPLPNALAQQLYALGHVQKVYNLYGPSEDTTYSTYALVVKGAETAPTIGRPIANTQAYLLDQNGQQVPIGVPGELYLAGDGLARGYLHQPALTEERFVENPFSKEPGARMYRTGDLARFLPNGELEYLGRIDHQVKVRGFRIELGEIETVLAAHPAVREAVVVVREDQPNEKRIVAYLAGEQELQIGELRRFVKDKLPDYMVPSAFVWLEALPLTPNGKVDRKALPVPEIRVDSVQSTEPRTETERILAEIWCRVLGLPQVGIHANFFELGGDSILSIQIVSRVNQAGLRVTPKQMFENQTIAELAEAIEHAAGTVVEIAAEQGIVTGEVPLLPIQQWFFEQEFANQHHWNQSMMLTVKKPMEPKVLEQAVQELLAHHDALRLRFVQEAGEWKQVNHELGDVVPFEVVDLSDLQESEQLSKLEVLAAEAQASLRLEEGPLMRVVYFDLGQATHGRLLIVIHHLAVDGVSWRILLDDLPMAYEQLSNGVPVQLASKTTSYKQWAEKLTEYATSSALQQELSYWLTQTEAVSALPVDHPEGVNTEASLQAVSLSLTAEETRALLQDVPSAYRTQINDVLLTALVQATEPWTGKRSLLVNLEGHGREEILEGVDLSRTVGWFTTMYPVLLDQSRATSLADALKAVKEQLRSIPNKGIGYGLLRYLSVASEALQQRPHAEITFNYLGQFDQMVSDEGDSVFGMATEARGAHSSAEARRSHLLDVTGAITGGQLNMMWMYSRELHDRTTIEGLAERFMTALRAIIAHCQSEEAFGYTPSDFPLATLNQGQLDRVIDGNRSIENVYPLSPLQHGLLFHTLVAEGAGDYVVQLSLTFQGEFDVPKFEQAWQQAVERHAILRTIFVWDGLEEPHQIVHKQANVVWEHYDWQAEPREEQDQHLQAFLQEDRAKRFDFTKPPMRFYLIRMAADTYQFVWSHHHVLLDGWSLPLVLGDVFALYNSLCKGEKLELGANTPFAHYIGWLQRQDMQEAENFWREMLAGFTAPTPIGKGSVSTGATGEDAGKRYGRQSVYLSEEQTTALQELARRNQLTMNTIVQGAWALLLSSYSGEADVVFGATGAGRPADLPGVESMVGLFINTLPVRVKVQAEDSVSEWLKQLQNRQMEMRQYEYSPLVNVQGWSEVPQGLPLFESLYVFENNPVAEGTGDAFSKLKISGVGGMEQTSYPVTLVAAPGKQLWLRFMYDQDRFDDATVERMLGHLTTVLDGMASQTESRVGELPMLTESEREQLLVTWNDTAADYPCDKTVHQLVEEQAALAPEHLAVQMGETALTYGELNKRANQLAHYLKAQGVSVGDLVGICMERSPEMLVGQLAVLKAGGAYVSMDPAYPQDRLAYLVENSQVKVLLTQERLLANLPQHDAANIFVDAGWMEIAKQSAENPIHVVTLDHLAYVIYTSGSTGMPKGVQVAHGNLLNLVNWHHEAYETTAQDRGTVLAGPAFDASVWEIWSHLTAGASLFIPDEETRVMPAKLRDWLIEQAITNTFLPTPLAESLLLLEWPAEAPLRYLSSGGDRLHHRPAATVPFAVVNLYGPTECTVITTAGIVEVEGTTDVAPSIGRPIANMQVYVLDQHQQLVPVGVPGELYISGAGLSKGYLNRPDLTEKSFVPHPFSSDPEARLYRTGDLVRYLPDGNIDFIGRIDNQVKIRGFRIELGEIESVLEQHPAVQLAVATTQDDPAGTKRLVAYVVADAEADELKRHLKGKLPDYMVPSLIVTMDSLPLTANGKIDRKRLPEPEASWWTSQEYVAPRGPLEELVANVWAEILQVERVGAYDNFFDLGGHSLLATRAVSRMREMIGVEVPLRGLFEHTTVAEFAEYVQSVRSGAAGLTEAPPIRKVERDGRELPLSYAQQRMWFLDRLVTEESFNNTPAVLRITSELNTEALEQSLNAILERHEALRTTFAEVGGRGVQVIAPELIIALPVISLEHLDAEARSVEVIRIADEEMKRPFDLSAGPLFRAKLLKLAEQEHVLLLNIHHIVFDGWSMGVLMRELTSFYEAFVAGRTADVPPLAVQYADYATWQREWLQGEVLEEQLSYWKNKLTGSEPLLELPTDRPRPSNQTFTGANLSIQLPQEIGNQLKACGREEGATLFMTLLAAYKALLSRYTGQHDILVGSPIAGRNRQEVEQLIGMFVNTLVFRTDLSGDPSFRELLTRVRDVALGAYAHQDVPFERIVDEVVTERTLSHSPLFQTMFILQKAEADAGALGGLEIDTVAIESVIAQFDLTLTMIDTEAGFSLIFEYNTDLFDRTTIERMGGHFEKLLGEVLTHPDKPISQILLMTEAEQQTLVEWNRTEADYQRDLCVHQLFEEQVERTPDAVAVEFDGASVTYAELNRRANQLARHLQAQGVQTESLVGICVERSIEMIVGIFGIMKAGGAYLPLDPAYPTERLAYMLADSQVSVLLTQQHLLDKLPEHQAVTVSLDGDWSSIAQQPADNVSCGVQADNLAYVIYTSGSTGQPKGVLVEHRGVGNLAKSMIEQFEITTESRILQFLSFSFDASVSEFVMTLLAGATLVMEHRERLLPGPDLLKLLDDHAITTASIPPSALGALEVKPLPKLKTLICGGDILTSELVSRWGQDRKIFNVYGPTEATVITTMALAENNGQNPTIGRPIANAQIYMLDRNLLPVPVGVTGELHIGGDGLARGYLNREDLTAERFITNPFGPGRLYKTGDLARYRPDGSIEFIGRVDEQVKVRGFRIELGEIETALLAHQAVKEVVVIVREDEPGIKRLVAYLVEEPGQEGLSHELRGYLKEKLPDYMVPAYFVVLERMPLSPTGKLNRKALPAPDSSQFANAATYVAPTTPQEIKLAEVWQKVLGVEQIGIHDNFFELGGDSILSIQIVSRASQAGLRLTPKQLFEHQTIVELARVVGEAPIVHAEQGIVTGEVPLLPIQNWFFDQNMATQHHWNQSMLLTVRDELVPDLLKQAVSHLLTHHDTLRLRFQQQEGGTWQQVNADVEDFVPFETVDLSALSESEQASRIAEKADETQQSLNLEQGPLMRVVHFNLGAEKQARLLIVVHHLAVDGVSWRILLEDLQTAYEQLDAGKPVVLPPKTTSYKHWAETLQDYAKSEVMHQERDYWLKQSEVEVAPLPVDHVGGNNTEATADRVITALTAEETRALLSDVPAAYRTQINDVLLTALVQTTQDWTGNSTLLINLEGHGREQIVEDVDLSRTVGWFTSQYPLALDIRKASTVADALKAVKEQLRQIPNKGIGYGIVRYLGTPETSDRLAQAPKPEISFNYLGQMDSMISSESLFGVAAESAGQNLDQNSPRTHLIDLAGMIALGQLQITWTYSQELHDRASIEQVANRYMEALRAIIAHCQVKENRGYTPSDFPLAHMTQEQMDQLFQGESNLENVYPLTPLQKGMMFSTVLEQDGGHYISQMAVTFQGEFDVPVFEKAWQQVVDRYDVLRTAFLWEGLEGKPHQVVYKQVPVTFVQQDISDKTAEEQEAAFQAYMQQDRKQSFDLAKPPLMRWMIFRLASDQYRFIWSNHHILLDGWSLPLILREVFTFYEATRQGVQVRLDATPTFASYIEWLQKQDLNEAKAFWQNELAGFTDPTPIPTANKLVAMEQIEQTNTHGEQTVFLSEQATTKLKALARQKQLTLNTFALGAWGLLLSRYNQVDDVAFGTTYSGRPAELPGVENMVGLFINTLPMRIQLQEEQTISTWLQQIQANQAQVRQYEYSPLVDVQSWSDVPSGMPLFQTLLVFENYPVQEAVGTEQDGNQLSMRDMQGIEQTDYPLTIVMAPGAELSLKIMYDRRIVLDESVEQMLRHLSAIMQEMIDRPEVTIADITFVTPAERQQLLTDWNQTQSDYPRTQSIQAVFEEQVAQTPDAVAVMYGSDTLTYQELNSHANRLAHYLRKQGVQSNSLVGICVDRSLEMVVGLLAILKAGGAYVPLDPSYPEDRLAFMIEDAGLSVLVTQEKWAERLRGESTRTICLDTDWAAIAEEVSDNLNSDGTADDLAYVNYTSGSTGTPKGVLIPHRGVVRLVKETSFARMDSERVFLQAATISFDAATFEIWGALLNGARLALLQGQSAAIDDIGQAIKQYGVTTMWLTVGLFNLIVDNKPDILQGVPQILVGGDALSVVHMRKAMAALPDTQFINGYGPTESTTFTCCHPITEADVRRGSIPIGRPIANTRVYVLDANKQPVPVGVPGELYIAGDGLALGYLNQPEMTAERFLSHAFAEGTEERLYRSGDNVRYLPDGNIEFLGRVDNQVKIRGYRIELGEIERTLQQHPAVLESIVLVHANEAGDKRIIAYVVLEEATTCTQGELRQFVKERLPGYMVPSALMLLESLPLTPNGKVDRKALPQPAEIAIEQAPDYVAPRTEMEKLLHEHWSTVLGVPQIGVHDNFFDVGGHSILATQLIFALRDELKLEIPLKVLFENPTLAGMAEMIEQIQVVGLSAVEQIVDSKDLRSEVVLDEQIRPVVPFDLNTLEASTWRAVFLTGATGFLGAFLLNELLESTPADVYCLTRAKDEAEGKLRLRQNMEKYGLWNEAYQDRVLPVIGDLGRPLLGLTEAEFTHLAEAVDMIYHNGAFVNFTYPYAAVKAPNVLGTQEVLRLAVRVKTKPVQFVSTLSVFPAAEEGTIDVIREEEMAETSEGLVMGYAQSKWVAEQLIGEARRRGIPAAIYRCGRISGHSQTGACQSDDLIWRIVKGSIELGMAPRLGVRMEMSPVDYISKAIVSLSQSSEAVGRNYHLCNPHPTAFEDILAAVRNSGYQVQTVPADKWLNALQDEAKRSQENSAATLGNVLAGEKGSSLLFAGRTTLKQLRAASVHCPEADTEYLERVVQYFKKSGYLEEPSLQK